MDYWPENAKIIQIETDPRRIGLVRPIDVGINGDCKLAVKEMIKQLRSTSDIVSLENIEERMQKLSDTRTTWENLLDSMTVNQANHRPGKLI